MLKLTPLEHVKLHCRELGLPLPEPEHNFTKGVREWAFDMAWPEKMVALEIEGGAFIGGRHTNGSGFVADMLKYNEAALRGWCVLRCVPKDAQSERIKWLIYRALTMRAKS
ncbi:hypothetical protein [Zavarzinella formosa]|uniref:hypothetical protein n=1 Tax=Zavarzinella formosa TaxID=360055 RepID=UPI0002E4E6F7|nr:hypothetical protein [Zavarzinella formosa]